MSLRFGSVFRIRGSLDCNSRHIVYVVTCHKCGLQGVGECTNPRVRLLTYIGAVNRTHAASRCHIHKHFYTEPHEPNDMTFCIVDRIPHKFYTKPALLPALRKRLEFIWTHRLGATLNKRKFIWQSFSGDYAARSKHRRTLPDIVASTSSSDV